MDEFDKNFEKVLTEYMRKFFPNCSVSVSSTPNEAVEKTDDFLERYNDSVESDCEAPDIMCCTCVNAITKKCNHCNHDSLFCALLDMDVDDEFYCKCWAEYQGF